MPRSKSTRSREAAFELISDLGRRPNFTDHFLTGFHLTRIDARGEGAGARFRVKAPLRSPWEDTTIVALDEPFKIEERGLGGRSNRIPNRTVWEIEPGQAGMTLLRVTHWTDADESRRQACRVAQLGRAFPAQRLEGDAEAPPRHPRGGRARRRADRRRRGQPLRDRHPVIESPPPMFTDRRRLTMPLLAALMLAVLALGVTACGSGDPSEVEEGEVVKVGELKYTVVFSRYLNPSDNEDAAYLKGLEPAQKEKNYFGVFLQVKNTSHESIGVVNELWITDSIDNKYEPIEVESEYAFPFGDALTEQETIPAYDSTAEAGPIQGAVVVFELPEEVSANRPLLLHIPGAGKEIGIVKLDL